jgi:hypothetical protein
MYRRRAAAVVAAGVVAAVLSGCATVPTSGPVRAGGDTTADQPGPAVRVIGRRPTRGAKPVDVVTGFLQASADLTNGSATARSYLTPEAASTWAPDKGVSVYDRSGLPPLADGDSDVGTGTVLLDGTTVARIDAGGHYSAVPPGTALEQQFRLRQVGGEWRITNPRDGLLLTAEDLSEAFRRVTLYFVSPGSGVLVPDPVYVPGQPQLATLLVQRLLGGVPKGLSGAATTPLPAGSTLATSSVPVRDGVARVSVRTPAGLTGTEPRRELSAQLVWTLGQLADVQAVHVVVDGSEIRLAGLGADQPVDSWKSFNPAGLVEGAIAYAVQQSRAGSVLGRIDGAKFSPVAGPAGDTREPIRLPAVSLDAQALATISLDGRSMSIGQITDDARFVPRLTGATNLSSPSWDVFGDVWVVDRRGATSRLWRVPESGSPQLVTVPPLAVGPVQLVRLARDGARIAVVAGRADDPTLFVGAVQRRPGGDRVVELHQVLTDIAGVVDVAWADATTLAVLGRRGHVAFGAFYVDIDGAVVRPVEDAPSRLVSIAAGPGARPLIGAGSDGRLFQLGSGRTWSPVGQPPGSRVDTAFRDPTYPG